MSGRGPERDGEIEMVEGAWHLGVAAAHTWREHVIVGSVGLDGRPRPPGRLVEQPAGQRAKPAPVMRNPLVGDAPERGV